MPAAIHLRGELHARIATTHIQRANAFRPVYLMTADGHDVDIVFRHVDRDLADGLGAVGMNQHAALFRDLADLTDVLHHADFVVGVHDAYQNGFVGDGGAELIQIHQAVSLDG